MAAKRETGTARSRVAARPAIRADGVTATRVGPVDMAAALVAAEQRAEEAERQLQQMRDRYGTLLAEASPDLVGRVAQLEATFDALADSIIVYGPGDRVLYMNAGARGWAARVNGRDHFGEPLAVRAARSHARDAEGNSLLEEHWPLRRAWRGETLTGARAVDILTEGPDGEECWINQSAVPLRDTGGEIIAVVVISRDVTAQRALERQARESALRAEAHAAQLEAVFDAITDGVYVYDRDGHIVQRNAAAYLTNPLLGHSEYLERSFEERIAGLDVRDEAGRLLDARDMPAARVLRGEVLMGDYAVDTSMRRLDGRVVHLNTTGAPVRGPEGAVKGAVIVARDVTERRQLERRTQEALAALLAMAEALVEVSDSDAEGEAQDGAGAPVRAPAPDRAGASQSHPVAHRLAELTRSVLGCSRVGLLAVDPETLVQQPFAVVGLSPEQERQWWDEQLQYPTRLGEGAPPEELERFLAGEIFVLDMTEAPYSALPNPFDIRTVLVAPMYVGDQIVGVLSLDHSGADHVYTPEELRLAAAVARLAALVVERERLLGERAEAVARVLALEEINRRMNEFLGIAGHELRTPLTSAKANIQLAERQLRRVLNALDAASDARITALSMRRLLTLFERTDQQMNRQQRLIDDLLDASRIQSGKLAMNPNTEDLRAILQDSVDEQRLLQPCRQISLDLPPSADPILIVADLDRIGQVLTNYLTNALKYSPEDAPVVVRMCVEDETVRVAVRDSGPGIPAEEQALIWEPFHRAPGVEVQSGSGVGLGLGLHISRTIIERHSGTVGVESQAGAGATFWFTLPLARAHEA